MRSEQGPTVKKVGFYWIMTAYHVYVVTSGMFVTAMSANLVCMDLAHTVLNAGLT